MILIVIQIFPVLVLSLLFPFYSSYAHYVQPCYDDNILFLIANPNRNI